ncbi:MAG TPA: putative glycoside hydrolase [Bacteroidia bacterium]|nr:putative glycoside hydrolase [Bacteroidia bacterium]
MKKILTVALSGILFSADAQIQSWPPGGTTPSPMGFMLPANRYVPSTKRFNLVWADQWFNLPIPKIQFVAQNYVATQKIFDYQVADYRAFNPNFLCTIYHLANGLNPFHNDDAPPPHTQTGSGCIGVVAPAGYVCEADNYFWPWLASQSIATGSAQYENMFQHFDMVDSVHRVWHTDPYWHMNLSNTDWRTYVGDICINWMSGNQNEGCFFDVSVETMVAPLFNPKVGDPAPYNFNWYITPHGPAGSTINTLNDFAIWMNNQYLNYYQYLYQRFHSAVVDYLVLPNTDQMITGWYDPTWTDGDLNGETIDGAMMESFGNATGSDMYLTLERGLRHITGRGKILIAQFYNNTQPERYRRTGMYMLIKNENSFINLADGNVDWFPEYEIDLGDQSAVPANINSLRVAGSGSASLFRRDYAEGTVLCNTSANVFTYTLTGSNWNKVVTSGGGAVDANGNIATQNISLAPVSSTVMVNPSDCIILKNTTSTGVQENSSPQIEMIVAQNLSEDEVTINIASQNNYFAEIFLSDRVGRKLTVVFSGNLNAGENNFNIDISALAAGIYFVTTRYDTAISGASKNNLVVRKIVKM